MIVVVCGGILEDVVMLDENEFECFDLGVILIHLVTSSSIPHRQLLRCPQ